MRAELSGAANGTTVLTELRAASPWAPRPLPPGAGAARPARPARVALVQTAATLLSGDDAAIEIEVGAGAALEIVETGATVAHHVRGGPPARARVTIRLGAGATLRWLAQPLVLAAGCDAVRHMTVELAEGARTLLRETVVLGRSGQQPGRLVALTRATHAGRPLLHEQLDTAAPGTAASAGSAATSDDDDAGTTAAARATTLRAPVVAGEAAVIDSVILLGARGADLPGAAQLAGPGTLWRALHTRDTDPDAAAGPVVAAWTEALWGASPATPPTQTPQRTGLPSSS